jgi:hypothetical protein
MRILRILQIAILAVVIFHSIDSFAYKRKKGYFSRPQIGGWFGPISPLAETAKRVETGLGGGIFFRLTMPWWEYLKFGVDSSYQRFKSKGVNELTFVPICGNILLQLPIDFAVRFQFKGGAGVGYIYIKPDELDQWDPVFFAGFEVSFPAGRIVNIGLRIDYYHIYEGYIKGSRNGGHILNTGISLYFNI